MSACVHELARVSTSLSFWQVSRNFPHKSQNGPEKAHIETRARAAATTKVVAESSEQNKETNSVLNTLQMKTVTQLYSCMIHMPKKNTPKVNRAKARRARQFCCAQTIESENLSAHKHTLIHRSNRSSTQKWARMRAWTWARAYTHSHSHMKWILFSFVSFLKILECGFGRNDTTHRLNIFFCRTDLFGLEFVAVVFSLPVPPAHTLSLARSFSRLLFANFW